jgi:hypothetical protein
MNGRDVESSGGSLEPLQRRILTILSGFEPPFVLGGGGALAIYVGHRQTRDLDLFWIDTERLGDRPRLVRHCLESAGLSVSVVQETPGFVRFRVTDGSSAVNLDLVADPTERLEPPVIISVSGADIQAESRRDLLANKLCALLSRSEIRDLADVEALVSSGLSLDEGIAQAPRKDGGFSPLTLAWVLRSFDLPAVAAATNVPPDDLERLEEFRQFLIERLLTIE